MKSLILALSLSALHADTITISGTNGNCDTTQASLCSPLPIVLPQFDPGLGALQSIGYSLSVFQEVRFGVNDMYDPLLGAPIQTTVIGGITSATLPIDVQSQQVFDGESSGVGSVSDPCCGFYQLLTTSGTDTNPADFGQFEGQFGIDVLLQPFGSATVTQSANGWPFAQAAYIVELSDALNVTYNYSPAHTQPTLSISTVPEPRGGYAVVGLLGLLVAAIKHRLKPPPSACWGCSAPGKQGPCPICGK